MGQSHKIDEMVDRGFLLQINVQYKRKLFKTLWWMAATLLFHYIFRGTESRIELGTTLQQHEALGTVRYLLYIPLG